MALFSNLKKCDDLKQYNLMYGVTDFSELEQFNMYESGYQFLKVIQIPKFIEELAKHNPFTFIKSSCISTIDASLLCLIKS